MRHLNWLTARRNGMIALSMRLIAMRLRTLALMEVIVLIMPNNWMLMQSTHPLLRASLVLQTNCSRAEGSVCLNVQNRILHVRGLGRPGVARNLLVLRNWITGVIHSWRKHD